MDGECSMPRPSRAKLALSARIHAWNKRFRCRYRILTDTHDPRMDLTIADMHGFGGPLQEIPPPLVPSSH